MENQFVQLIKDELNVKEVKIEQGQGELTVTLDLTITPELANEGMARELMRDIQVLRKEAGCRIDQRVSVTLSDQYQSLPKELLDLVKRQTLTTNIVWGGKSEIIL